MPVPDRRDTTVPPLTVWLWTVHDAIIQKGDKQVTDWLQAARMSGLPGVGYYSQQYQPADSRRSMDGYAQDGNMNMPGDGSTANGMTNGGQSLDEIIHQNNLEMMRRRTYQQPQFRQPNPDNHGRRSSMLEFGAPLSDDLANFQF